MDGSTVKISYWADLAGPSAGIKNNPKKLCSHVIPGGINQFLLKIQEFVSLAFQNKKVINFLLVAYLMRHIEGCLWLEPMVGAHWPHQIYTDQLTLSAPARTNSISGLKS